MALTGELTPPMGGHATTGEVLEHALESLRPAKRPSPLLELGSTTAVKVEVLDGAGRFRDHVRDHVIDRDDRFRRRRVRRPR